MDADMESFWKLAPAALAWIYLATTLDKHYDSTMSRARLATDISPIWQLNRSPRAKMLDRKLLYPSTCLMDVRM